MPYVLPEIGSVVTASVKAPGVPRPVPALVTKVTVNADPEKPPTLNVAFVTPTSATDQTPWLRRGTGSRLRRAGRRRGCG